MGFRLGMTGPYLSHRDESKREEYAGPAIYCLWLVKESSKGKAISRRQYVGETDNLKRRISEHKREFDGRRWNFYSYRKAPYDTSERKYMEREYIIDLEPYHNTQHNPR